MKSGRLIPIVPAGARAGGSLLPATARATHTATALTFHDGQDACAADLVELFHYSGRVPGNVQFIASAHESGGLFGDFGPCVAAAFWSIPPTRWSEDVIELSRLVRTDDAEINLTELLAWSARALKARGADLLVSFADATQGHHGGIYQAASWAYHGKRERRMDGVLIDGTFVPGRSCNSRWGTQSPFKLTRILGREVEPHYDEGKHLYWRALGKRGKRKAERLGLKSMPYPKPATEGLAS